MAQREQIRIRASRACQRCSKRKTKCDAAEAGLPCTRCKLDQRDNCQFVQSRRGTYDRSRSTANKQASAESWETLLSAAEELAQDGHADTPGEIDLSTAPGPLSTQGGRLEQSVTNPLMPNVFSMMATSDVPVEESQSASPMSRLRRQVDLLPNVQMIMPRSATHGTTTPREHFDRGSRKTISSSEARKSLAAAFEDFLDEHGYGGDALEKCGIIFMNEASPLTFALEELRRSKGESLHDIGSSLSKNAQDNTGNAAPNASVHPSHLTPATYTYLNAHGAFAFPGAELLSSLVEAFLQRFLPIYPIVDRADFEQRYQKQKLPWLLMHAVCFVGATFCDQSVIQQAGFRRRWHARRSFYDKAKILFDTGYETNKVTLLQTVLMLTFWGPQMRSYWNPCSWVGFAVTIAESLGINQSVAIKRMNPNDKGLLRRLWWILVLRDASCASFLGRPFRINLTQCDMEPLSEDDFAPETGVTTLNEESSAASNRVEEPAYHLEALYLVKVVELSMLLRKIVEYRSKKEKSVADAQELHAKLNAWKSELPDALKWHGTGTSPSNVFSSSLKVIFYHHVIMIYLEPSKRPEQTVEPVSEQTDQHAMQTAKDAASMISASALPLVTSSILNRLPHEVLTAFSIAGIVFYRQIFRSGEMNAEIGRAMLDNCRMIISEAREQWDAGPWMIRVFDFLLSNMSTEDRATNAAGGPDIQQPAHMIMSQENSNWSDLASTAADVLHSIDWESPQFQRLARTFNEELLFPVFENADDFMIS